MSLNSAFVSVPPTEITDFILFIFLFFYLAFCRSSERHVAPSNEGNLRAVCLQKSLLVVIFCTPPPPLRPATSPSCRRT